MISAITDFFNKNKKITAKAACALSAALAAFCVMFTELAPLQWLALVPAAVCIFRATESGVRAKKAYLCGLGFFLVYYFVLFHWFVFMYPLDFLGMGVFESVIVVAVAWLGLSFLQASFSALALPVFALASKKIAQKHKYLLPVLAACLWVLLEWGLTLTWAGVPWSRLALGQADTLAVVQSASVFGSYFITFLIVIVNFLIAYTLIYKRKLAAAVAVCLFAANLAFGGMSLATCKGGEKLTVAAAQGNISSNVKWNDSLFVSSFRVYADYTVKSAEQGAKVVLLPETAVPFTLAEGDVLSEFLSGLSKQTGVYLLVGAFSEEGADEYNSIFVFEPDGSINETLYSKRRLVPFGEFLPFASVIKAIIPPLANLNAISSDLTPGADSNVINTEYANLGCLICFDSIYESLARDSVKDGAQIIMLATNDSWFSDSAALRMHNNQARLRAIETRRSVVRAANTGISSVISPTGEVLDSVGALKKGLIVEDVELNDGLTLYTRIGNLFVYLCGAFVAFLLAEHIKSRYCP